MSWFINKTVSHLRFCTDVVLLEKIVNKYNIREAAKKVPPLMARPLRGKEGGNGIKAIKEKIFFYTKKRWLLSSKSKEKVKFFGKICYTVKYSQFI